MILDGLRNARLLFEEGRFRSALQALQHSPPHDPELLVLFAEALDETGDSSRAFEILQHELECPRTTGCHRAACLRTLAVVQANSGDNAAALVTLQSALMQAEAAAHSGEAARAAMRLFSLQFNLDGADAAATSLSKAKKFVLRSTDERLTADLHSRVGQAEAQSGRYHSALYHLSTALDILQRRPHLLVSARTALALSSTNALIARNDRAVRAAKEALEAASKAGSVRLVLLCRANLAQLLLRADRPAEAVALAREVLDEAEPRSLLRLAVLETLVASSLEIGELSPSPPFLHEFLNLMQQGDDHSWIHVEAVPTLARILLDGGQVREAISAIDEGLEGSERRGDSSSTARLLLLQAEILIDEQHGDSSWARLDALDTIEDRRLSADVVAGAERVKGLLAAREGSRRLAYQHFKRSERVFRRCGLRLEARRSMTLRREIASSVAGKRLKLRFIGQRELAAAVEFLIGLAAYPRLLKAELEDFIIEQELGRLGKFHGDGSSHMGRRLRIREAMDPADSGSTLELIGGDERRSRYVLPPLAKVLDLALRQNEVRHKTERLHCFWEVEASSEGLKGLYVADEMKQLLNSAQMIARSSLPILILGETGTGKEILAADIHASSGRSKRPFMPFNVTAVSRDLLESQLFGARRGSFTGAVSDMKGLIREAEGGTIFLDEIGEMSLDLQPKLLRFVEQGEIQPVGERPQHVDVRVIAATNASLRDLVREGRFREDLFHRLNVVPLCIPPLRDRREEIPTFVRHFLARHAADAGKPVPDIAPVTLERLVAADWPGNVRQLNNELKRIVALLPEGAVIDLAHLSPEVLAPPTTPLFASAGPSSRVSIALGRPLDHIVGEAERAAIEHAMVQAGGNVSEAARSLGVTRRGLYLKRQRLGMDTTT